MRWRPTFRAAAIRTQIISYAGGRVQYNNGAWDGFLRSGRNDEYAIG